MPATLAPSEKADFDRLEGVIREGLQTFVDVGNALNEIKERQLYRAVCSTYQTYVQIRWKMSRAYADRQIAAAETVKLLSTTAPIGALPESESVARPLTTLPPEQQPEVWKEAVEKAASEGKKVTAEHVKVAAEARKAPKPKHEKPEAEGNDEMRTNGNGKHASSGSRVTLPEGMTPEAVVRSVADLRKDGGTLTDAASTTGVHAATFAKMERVVLLADREDLSPKDRELARSALAHLNETSQATPAYRLIEELDRRVYGDITTPSLARREANRNAAFERAWGALIQACTLAPTVDVPYLSPARAHELLEELDEAVRQIRTFRDLIKEYVA